VIQNSATTMLYMTPAQLDNFGELVDI